MHPDLVAIADRQAGLVTRAQAQTAGIRGPELRGLTSVGGQWEVVRRGVYMERIRWAGLSQDEQWLARDRAAHLSMNVLHELSHDSAARLHGLPLVGVRRQLTHVSRPDVQGSRTEHGVKHHKAVLPSRTRGLVDGLPVTGLARTAVDVAREHGLAPGLVACDAALRAGAGRTALRTELAGMAHWPGVVAARAASELADPRAESPGESLARLFVIELGLGEVEPQFALRLSHRVVWVDLRVGRHCFEFDGRVKYRPPSQGGVADRRVEEIVWEERQREREICSIGLGMSRLSWDDLFGLARERAKARCLAEYAVTHERFGSALPEHLAEFSRDHSHDRIPARPRAS